MNTIKNVTFIGLGTMGYHMAGHLSKNPNINITVWNRGKDKSTKWGNKFQGNIASSIKESLNNADVVLTCTGRDEDMEQLVYSDNGIYQNIKDNTVFIDHTTTSYNLTQKLAQSFKSKNVEFLDAPMSGGDVGSKNGCLSVMVGGNKQTLDAVSFIIDSYAKSITYIGKTGSGQLAKMTNQICIAGILQGLSSAIIFAENENIDINTLIKAISGGAAQSWQMDNVALTMHNREFNFGFTIKWALKDLGYCLDRAKENETDLSFVKNVYNKYKQLIEEGKDNLDTSSLILKK